MVGCFFQFASLPWSRPLVTDVRVWEGKGTEGQGVRVRGTGASGVLKCRGKMLVKGDAMGDLRVYSQVIKLVYLST